MEKIILVPPALDFAGDLACFRREVAEAGDADSFAGCSRLEHYDRASEKTILANGGVYEKTVDADGDPVKRYWIDLQQNLT